MGREDHIRSLRIQNFKCFEDFTMENIGQFNLIVGANNSGKTSLLEALLIASGKGGDYLYQSLRKRFGFESAQNGKDEFNFIQLLKSRNSNDALKLQLDYDGFYKWWELNSMYLSEIRDEPEINDVLLKLYGSQEVAEFRNESGFVVSKSVDSAYNDYKYPGEMKFIGIVRLRGQEFELRKGDFLPLIGASDFHRSDLVSAYTSSIQQDKERKKAFVDVMKIIIPELDDIEPTEGIVPWGSVIGLWLRSENRIVPLAEFGDGTVRLFRIVLTMFYLNGGLHPRLLLIDEVDYGIHQNLLPQFWEKLIEMAFRLDIQLFMTTHNDECVKAYWKAFESDELKNRWGLERDQIARHFILERDKVGIPRSYSLPHSHLGSAIENDNNFMGR